jgi:hypothetical protein
VVFCALAVAFHIQGKAAVLLVEVGDAASAAMTTDGKQDKIKPEIKIAFKRFEKRLDIAFNA